MLLLCVASRSVRQVFLRLEFAAPSRGCAPDLSPGSGTPLHSTARTRSSHAPTNLIEFDKFPTFFHTAAPTDWTDIYHPFSEFEEYSSAKELHFFRVHIRRLCRIVTTVQHRSNAVHLRYLLAGSVISDRHFMVKLMKRCSFSSPILDTML